MQGLRDHLPVLPYEKKLSKVDTLKQAINYIQILAELVSRDPREPIKSPSPPPVKKFIVRSCLDSPEGESQLHSLSWSFDNGLPLRGNIMTAKIWIPDDPRNNSDSSSSFSQENNCRRHEESPQFTCDNQNHHSRYYLLHSSSPKRPCQDLLAQCCQAIASHESE